MSTHYKLLETGFYWFLMDSGEPILAHYSYSENTFLVSKGERFPIVDDEKNPLTPTFCSETGSPYAGYYLQGRLIKQVLDVKPPGLTVEGAEAWATNYCKRLESWRHLSVSDKAFDFFYESVYETARELYLDAVSMELRDMEGLVVYGPDELNLLLDQVNADFKDCDANSDHPRG